MFLNTLTKDELYYSLASVFSTNERTVRDYIINEADNIVNNSYRDFTIDSLDLTTLKRACNCNELKAIEFITVNHITPRENVELLMHENIMTLPHALTRNTALSIYLKGKGFDFKYVNNRIHMKKDEKEVDFSKLHFSNLLMRLGGENTFNDFNVNGYLFANSFHIEECRGWLGSPEILKSLSNAFADKHIADDYANRCNNYLISFRVPIESIDIECYDANISTAEKTNILVKYSINALAHYEVKSSIRKEFYNPIIMLKRDYDVPYENIMKLWRFDYINAKLIPIELTE
jgi:hypothetical protein